MYKNKIFMKKILRTNSTQRIITGLILATMLYALFFHCPPILLTLCLIVALFMMLAELKNMIPNSITFYALAPIYPIFPCLILIYFNQNIVYKNLLLYLFILVFTFDSASYFTGKLCSKFWKTKKIVPAISPGKSLEGVCGGYLATTWILFSMTNLNAINSDLILFFISAMICTIAFAGDIFESYLKRSVNIKDSGTILPGHGGMLDRFDAILGVSYFFFIFKDFLLKLFL